MKRRCMQIMLLATVAFSFPVVLLSETNTPAARIAMRTIYVHSTMGDTLVPEEAKTIMLSKKFVGATVDVLGLANRWRMTKSDACDLITKSFQIERTAVKYEAVVRMVGIDREDAVRIINELCFMLANCRVTGAPSTEEEMRNLASTNLTPDFMSSRTMAIGRTNTALIAVLEYAK